MRQQGVKDHPPPEIKSIWYDDKKSQNKIQDFELSIHVIKFPVASHKR